MASSVAQILRPGLWRQSLLFVRSATPHSHRYRLRHHSPTRSRVYSSSLSGLVPTLEMPGSPRKPLDFDDGPMVWIDLEMTGLTPGKDKIIEIAVLITNGNLELVDKGVQYIIRTEKRLLDGMDEWCTKQHGQSGLTKACLKSPYTTEVVKHAVLDYIKKWIPRQRIGVLAGNSVHVDRAFLAEEMPEIVDWLHYRIIDVSSIKELARRWYPNNAPPKTAETSHRALDDIQGSIRELKWYRENLFIPPVSSGRDGQQ